MFQLHCWGQQSLTFELVVLRSLVLLHRAHFRVPVPSTAADRRGRHNRLKPCMWKWDSVTVSMLCCNLVRLAYQSPSKICIRARHSNQLVSRALRLPFPYWSRVGASFSSSRGKRKAVFKSPEDVWDSACCCRYRSRMDGSLQKVLCILKTAVLLSSWTCGVFRAWMCSWERCYCS